MSAFYSLIPAGVLVSIYLVRKLREYQWGWVRAKYSLEGKIYIITGANTGLGYETAKALAKRNATIILACRSMDRATQAIVKIRQETANGNLIPICLDLASFDSIREFAAKIKAEFPKFNCLINNAGLAVQGNHTSKEGFELHFATNHLGHFLLVDLLKDEIKLNHSRIVVVSSLMHQYGKIDFETLGTCSNPDGQSRRKNVYYNNSKLYNFYFARELYKQGYDTHILCPGLCNTDFFRDYNLKWYHYVLFSPVAWLFLRSSKQGAQSIIFCATDNVNTSATNPFTGYLIRNLKQLKSKFDFQDAVSEHLWRRSLVMAGIEPDEVGPDNEEDPIKTYVENGEK